MTEWKVGQKVTLMLAALGRIVDQKALTISEVTDTKVITDDGVPESTSKYKWKKTDESVLFLTDESRNKSRNGHSELDKTEMTIRHARSDDEREISRLERWGTVARWQYKLCRLELPAEITDEELKAIYLATKTLSRIIKREPTNEVPGHEY